MAETGLPFGKKLSEAIAEEQAAAITETEVATEPVVEGTEAPKEAEVKPEAGVKVETPPEPVKAVTWLEEVNKAYKTEFKTPEEFGQVFDKTKKVNEYESKIKGYEDSEIKYKEQLQELRSSLNPLEYFSSRESYVAEQLRKQHPDKSPSMLQEIVTSDAKVMDDLDVLIKNEVLENPDLIGGEQGAKDIIFDRYGLDSEVPKAEWSTLVQNKIKVEARTARKAWDELKATVTMPTLATPEEREAEKVRLLEEKKQNITPIKETFSKFPKFTVEIDEGKILDFNVPSEYEETLPAMFDAFFLNGGLDVTEENLSSMEDLKKGLMLLQNIKQIYKTIEGDVETRMKAERDKLLGNEAPSNTTSGLEADLTEDQRLSKEHGFGKMFGK